MSLYLKNAPDPEIVDLIADFICGDDVEKYPEYRSSYYLTKFFNNIGIKREHDGTTRKRWVLDVLKSLSLENLEKVILRLVDLREYRADIKKLKKALSLMNNILMMDGLKIEFDKNCPKIIGINRVDINEVLEIKNISSEKGAENNEIKVKKYVEIDRDKYLTEFEKDNFPIFQCPKCESGFLEIIKDMFNSLVTEESNSLYNAVGEVSDLERVFVSFLKCNNKKCNEISLINGEGGVEKMPTYDETGEPVLDYLDYYSIKYFNPPVHIINIPSNASDEIKSSLKESFLLFWIDCSSAGNKIRKALDLLMDCLNIDKCKLHHRIEKFGKIKDGKYLELSEVLMGVKWLGNFGSHKEGLKKENLLDAYEVLDFVLHEIFTKDDYFKKVKSKAKNLEKKYKK